jgi:LysR family transcriptional regulator, positive regulator for ilvC
MDIRSLQLFLSLAETLNFSRTAEQRHLSLSAVSRGVQRLEEQLGQRLFERDKRTVRITIAGERFREYAQRAVTDWQEVLSDFHPDPGKLSGEVRVYCSVTASYSVLSPILERFRVQYPDIEILLHTGDQADAISRIHAGVDDVSVAACPDELPNALDFLVLQQSPLQFIAPVSHCAVADQVAEGERNGDIPWQELPFIVAERGLSKERLDRWFSVRKQQPRIYAQVAGHEAIAAMVGLGLGVGLVPELVVNNSAFRKQLRVLPAQPALQPFPVGLCSLKQRLDNVLVAAFWNVAMQVYANSSHV